MSTSNLHELETNQGRVLGGRFQLEAKIGHGAAGSIYRARDLRKGGVWAIKLMKKCSSLDLCATARFTNEGAIVSQLCHPNIVEVREFHVDSDGTPFLVMELLSGEDLLALLARHRQLPLAQVLDIVGQVGSALHIAHTLGIVHRDIKPSNIFLSQPSKSSHRSGLDRTVVKVIDFGIAKTENPQLAQQTALGLIVGTPQYLPPECTQGDGRAVDGGVDQWALAVVTYRMLSGRLPFEEADPVKLIMKIRNAAPVPLKLHVPGLPEPVYQAIDRALSKRPQDRFPTIAEFVKMLHGIRSMAVVTEPALPVAPPRELPQALPPKATPTLAAAPSASLVFSITRRASNRPQRRVLAASALLVGLAVLGSTIASLPASAVRSRGTAASPPGPLSATAPTPFVRDESAMLRPAAGPSPAKLPATSPLGSPGRPPGTRFPPLRLAGKVTS